MAMTVGTARVVARLADYIEAFYNPARGTRISAT